MKVYPKLPKVIGVKDGCSLCHWEGPIRENSMDGYETASADGLQHKNETGHDFLYQRQVLEDENQGLDEQKV
ncbi:MAG: hypothetical protein FJ044_02475 [Candidatus Cloacimonetes bacterium]|nr:hypothetical protein [Candidatus Cloacimonadota bacterium]